MWNIAVGFGVFFVVVTFKHLSYKYVLKEYTIRNTNNSKEQNVTCKTIFKKVV